MTTRADDAISMLNMAAFWEPRDFTRSSWTGHVPFAFWLVEKIRPRCIVELGTWHGMSYLAFCQAVQTLGLATKTFAVDTWMGDTQAGTMKSGAMDALRAIHDPQYSAFSTMVRSTFDDALDQFADGTIDLLHIDGLHTYEAVKHDFETWRPKMSDRGIILFHDTQARHDDFGVYRLWAELQEIHPSFEFEHEHGLGVIAVGPEIPDGLAGLFEADTPNVRQSMRLIFSRLGDGLRDRQRSAELHDWLERYRNAAPIRFVRTVRDALTRPRR